MAANVSTCSIFQTQECNTSQFRSTSSRCLQRTGSIKPSSFNPSLMNPVQRSFSRLWGINNPIPCPMSIGVENRPISGVENCPTPVSKFLQTHFRASRRPSWPELDAACGHAVLYGQESGSPKYFVFHFSGIVTVTCHFTHEGGYHPGIAKDLRPFCRSEAGSYECQGLHNSGIRFLRRIEPHGSRLQRQGAFFLCRHRQ